MSTGSGYSPSGYEALKDSITNAKNQISEIFARFRKLNDDIGGVWFGNDADKYRANFEEAINNASKNVEDILSSMSSQFAQTYNAWVDKQNG